MALDELQSKQLFGDHWSLFAEANGHVKGGKHRASLAKQISCKLQELIKKSMKIRWDFSHFFFSRSIVSPWQKQHFFQNAHKRVLRFSPDGLFMAHRVAHIRHINRNSMIVIESFPSIPIFYHFFFHFQTVFQHIWRFRKKMGVPFFIMDFLGSLRWVCLKIGLIFPMK